MSTFVRLLTISATTGEARVTYKTLAIAAIISTASLFFSTSAQAQAQQDYRADFLPQYTMSPTGVNLQTGRYEHRHKLFELGPFSYTYGEKSGYGAWVYFTVSGNTQYAAVSVGELTVKFRYVGPGATNPWQPDSSAAAEYRFKKVGALYYLTHKSGTVYAMQTFASTPTTQFFDKNHFPLYTQHPDGHRFDFTYDAQDRLTKIISNKGYMMIYELTSAGLLSKVCGYNLAYTESTISNCASAVQKGTFTSAGTIDAAGRLVTSTTSVNSSTGQTVNCKSYPGSSICPYTNTYGPTAAEIAALAGWMTKGNQVRKQVTADGQTWTFTYIPPDPTAGDDGVSDPFQQDFVSATEMIDPNGAKTTVHFFKGLVTSVQSPAGTYSFQFNGLQPVQITHPEGNNTKYDMFDGLMNVGRVTERSKPGSSLPDQIYTQTFLIPGLPTQTSDTCAQPNLCDKPLTQTDAKGNATNFTYDPAHGGVLTKTSPAVNGVSPQTRYTYVQRNAWKKSGASYVAMQPSIWVLASEEYCKTTAASGAGCVGGAADEVVTTYDYGPNSGPNNLLLRGTIADSGDLNLRTCYTYDQYSRKIAETQPEGTGGTCP